MKESYELGLQQVEESKADLQDILPAYGTEGAACFDLRADLLERDIRYFDSKGESFSERLSGRFSMFTLEPQERVLIPTGFIFDIPEGFQMNIYSRSGMTWKNGVIVLNAPAIIDEDYNLETFVVLYNTSNQPFVIEHGGRIAQAAINPVYRVGLQSLGSRTGGFGSTGGEGGLMCYGMFVKQNNLESLKDLGVPYNNPSQSFKGVVYSSEHLEKVTNIFYNLGITYTAEGDYASGVVVESTGKV